MAAASGVVDLLSLVEEEDDEVSNRILDRLSEVWAERGASCCCCWEGVGAAVVMVDMSCVLCSCFCRGLVFGLNR